MFLRLAALVRENADELAQIEAEEMTLAEYSWAKTIRSPSGRKPLPQWPAAAEVLNSDHTKT